LEGVLDGQHEPHAVQRRHAQRPQLVIGAQLVAMDGEVELLVDDVLDGIDRGGLRHGHRSAFPALLSLRASYLRPLCFCRYRAMRRAPTRLPAAYHSTSGPSA